MDEPTLDRDAVPYTAEGMKLIGIRPVPSPSTLHRWRLRGRFGIVPWTFLRGGRRFTTRAAMALWFEQITAAAEGQRIPQQTSNDRDRARREAHERLAAEGL
jgi:hypothetical protein